MTGDQSRRMLKVIERLPPQSGTLISTSSKWCSMSPVRSLVRSRLPLLSWLPTYTATDALSDLIAGVTVGLTVIPQGDVPHKPQLRSLSRYRLCSGCRSPSSIWTLLRLHGKLRLHLLRELQGENNRILSSFLTFQYLRTSPSAPPPSWPS